MMIIQSRSASDAAKRYVNGFFSSLSVLPYFTQTGGRASFGVFSYAFPGYKMRVHLLTAPGILVIKTVTSPSTIRAQRCLTLVFKWVPVCPNWQDSVIFVHVSTLVSASHFQMTDNRFLYMISDKIEEKI
jgi:hypothetical protein